MSNKIPLQKMPTIVEATQEALEKFKERLQKAFALLNGTTNFSKTFHDETQIMQFANHAKLEQINYFKQQLQNQHVNSINARAEMLEILLDTIVSDHIKENGLIREESEMTMHARMESLLAGLTKDLQGFYNGNSLAENQHVAENHEKLKADIIAAWNKFDKSGYPEFQQMFYNNLQKQMHEIFCAFMQKHMDLVSETKEKAEVEIVKLGQTFEIKLMVKFKEFDMNMIPDLDKFVADRQQQTQEEFVQKEMNPFPISHPLHNELNKKLEILLQTKFEKLKREVLYPNFVRQCCAQYLVAMEAQLFELKYVPQEQVQLLHESTSSEVFNQRNSLHIDNNKAFESEFSLERKIDQAFILIQNEVSSLNAATDEQIKNLVRKCQRDYELEMKQQIEQVHRLCKDNVKKVFIQECPVKSDDNFTEKHKKCLDEYLEQKLAKHLDLTDLHIPISTERTPIDGSHTNSNNNSLFDSAKDALVKKSPNSLELDSLTRIFERVYQKEIDAQRSKTGSQEISEANYQKLFDICIRAFEKLSELEAYHVQDLLKNMKSRLERVRQLDQQNIGIQKLIEKMKSEYNSKLNDLLAKYQNINDFMTVSKHHESIQFEVKKLLEMEIKKKFGSVEPTELHKQALQIYIDKHLVARIIDVKYIRSDLLKPYNEQMGKYCKNTPFILPKELNRLHEESRDATLEDLKMQTSINSFLIAVLERDMEDMYDKYKTENIMKLNFEKGAALAIGIDLGRSYCRVAVYYNGKVILIPNQELDSSESTASYVMYNPDGTKTIGDAAKQSAYKNPENTIYDINRIIGRRMNDPELKSNMPFWPFDIKDDNGMPKVNIYGRLYTPEQVSAELLSHLRVITARHLGLALEQISKAVITVPAGFNDHQRQATKNAGELAGLDVMAIISESKAAVMAYSLDRPNNAARKVLVLDLGRSAFNVTVLDVSAGKIQVSGFDSDTRSGGEHFDNKIIEFCTDSFLEEEGIDLMDEKDSPCSTTRYEVVRRLRRLRTSCESAKKELSSKLNTIISIDVIYKSTDLRVDVTRDMFEKLNMQLFQKTIDLVDKVILQSGIRKQDIEEIYLVGSSTQIPKVQEMLKTYFAGKALLSQIDAEKVVAYGAAIMAAKLNGEHENQERERAEILPEGKNKSSSVTKAEFYYFSIAQAENGTKNVEQWLQEFNRSKTSEIGSFYAHIFQHVFKACHTSMVNANISARFTVELNGNCTPKCNDILGNISNQVEIFNLGLKRQFDLQGYFTFENFSEITRNAFQRAMESYNSDEFSRRMVTYSCGKLSKFYDKHNERIKRCEYDMRDLVSCQLINIYHDQMNRYLEDAPLSPEKLQRIHWKLTAKLMDVFEKVCTMNNAAKENDPESRDNIKERLSSMFGSYKETNARKLSKLQIEIKRIIQKMKNLYNEKVEKLLMENSDGLDERTLKRYHDAIQSEIMKLMEMEIKQKLRAYELLEMHKQALQAHIDGYWRVVMQVNKENVQKRHKRQREMEARNQKAGTR